MIVANSLQLSVGARVLIDAATFQIGAGYRVGLVGRNGAGKSTLLRTLSGELLPGEGTLTRSGSLGYLPQDPRTGDLSALAMNRILSGRGLDTLVAGMEAAMAELSASDAAGSSEIMSRYSHLEEMFQAGGGYAAEAEAASIASS